MLDSSEIAKKSKVPDFLPLSTLAALGVWFIVSRLSSVPHPPVGTFIGVLAFVAGIATIWPPDSAWAKAGWIIVFGAFLVLEVSTLYQQRAEDESTARQNRIKEDNRFAELLKSQESNFGAILQQNQEQFTASLRRMENILGTVTGGDSYPIYSAPIIEDVTNGIQLMVMVHGVYSIRDATINLLSHTQTLNQQNAAGILLHPESITLPLISNRQATLLPLRIRPNGTEEDVFTIQTTATNGNFNEVLTMRLVDGRYQYRYRITNSLTGRILENGPR